MSDLETRLRDTLVDRAAAAPDALGLATGARRRLRRRRTTWAVAAAAVVAAGVPLGLSQLGPSSDGTGPVADEPAATSGLPPGVVETGFRAESWRDVTFQVPVDWGYGSPGAWCASQGPGAVPEPVVQRPGTVSPAIACSPADGYGVSVGSAAAFDPAYASGEVWRYDSEGVVNAQYPDDTWLSYWYDGSDVVIVATPDRGLTTRIVGTVSRFQDRDPNGCPVTLGEAEAALGTGSYITLSLCRYDADDLLSASRRLIGVEADPVEAAIQSSPRRTVDYDCPTEDDLSRTVLLAQGGYIATAVTDASCDGLNGYFWNGVVRDLTPEAERYLDLSQLPPQE